MMVKKAKPHFTNRVNVWEHVKPDGTIIRRYVEGVIAWPKSSSVTKSKKLITILQDFYDKLKISNVTANAIARIVMNWKPPKNKTTHKHKNYITTNIDNDNRFKQSFKTELFKAQLCAVILGKVDALKIEEPDKLRDMIRDCHTTLWRNYPKEYLTLPDDFVHAWMSPQFYKQWYCNYTDTLDWQVKMSDEEIKQFFEAEYKKVQEGIKAEKEKEELFPKPSSDDPGCIRS